MVQPLILELTSLLQVYQPQNLEFDDFTKFHSDEYIDFLQKITPDHQVLPNALTSAGGSNVGVLHGHSH